MDYVYTISIDDYSRMCFTYNYEVIIAIIWQLYEIFSLLGYNTGQKGLNNIDRRKYH